MNLEQEVGKWNKESDFGLKEFDFVFGDFNNLLDISRKELQPILFDYNNFYKKKQSLFDKDQMKQVFRKCRNLKYFREAEISKLENKNNF